MIVTCPGCASKYRVRNEAVPAEGARMRCPKCETLFLAKPPQNGEGGNDDVSAAPFGAPGFAAPQTSTGYPTGQLLAQPGGMQQPVVPYQPSGQTAGGFPSLPPQAATPFSAPFGAAPSLPPQPAPFPGSMPPQPSPFGQPGGFVPQQPNTSGPLTSMMRSFDAAALAQAQQAQQQQQSSSYPSTSGPAVAAGDDDPFARINVDPRQDPGLAAPTVERMRPTPPPTRVSSTAMTSPPPTSTNSNGGPSPAPSTRFVQKPAGPPSMAMVAASWVALVLGGFGAIFGIVFAAWTSEAVDLDASLMPTAESVFGASPPYSFTGRDAVDVDELRRQATAKETAGDLPAAIVLWQRVQASAPDDPQAKTALPRVQSALGERLR